MKQKSVKRVRVTDKMVLVGLGLAAIYWFLDTFLFIFMSYDVQLFNGFFGLKLSDIWTRVIVCCLFVIFGSHAQFTINNRKIIEEALRKREERYRTIIENTEDGYYETDLRGNLVFFNDAVCRITGYGREELQKIGMLQTLNAANEKAVSEYFDTVHRSGEALMDVEWTLVRKDGQQRFVESSISLIKDSKAQPAGFRGFLRDITKRKRDEALKQEKLTAEAASKSKSEFLANMSHEIRTPLNSILGLAELLMSTELSSDQKEDLYVINAAAHALLALINDILDFSKIEAGKLALEHVCFSLRAFLGKSLRIMASKAHEKGIELAFRVAPDVPERIYGDPTRFRQIILNLVGNALKFTDQGEVIVDVQPDKSHKGGVDLHFSVRDTGIGIPKDKQAGIFRTFEQADGSTSRRFGGTGLGLAVSSQLVELMGGRIWVESEPGQGSNFHFTAQFGRPEDASCHVLQDTSEALRDIRALVVDDNAANLRIVSEQLAAWGMGVETAAGTDAARKLLERSMESDTTPSLTVIDIDMPHPDGMELAGYIRDRQDLNTRMVAMLTPSSIRQLAQLEDLGVSAFVHKPISPPELMKAVMNALGMLASLPDDADQQTDSTDWTITRPLRILVAEDTPFNQKFIKRLLQRWGHISVIAENGIEALDILDRERFDLILMDVQMPEMDGFEATQAIREREKKSAERIPIIAMTAHAMKGDRERCIDAGMDDYVSKPISTETLQKTIQELVGQGNNSGTSVENGSGSESDTRDAAAFDREALLNAFDHDWPFLKETVDMLLEDYPPMLSEIRQALTNEDAAGLRRTAHALKGMVGNFQAKAAAAAALALEDMGRRGALSGGETAVDKLEKEMERFKNGIVAMIEKETP